ncbi:hypothetical protein LEP1GSC171_2558 [Leptospira santarosai str. HAI1380]|nr:hypothetical protein LEP1GSC171_2558 [Leptospira santarosai str. HAI1380]
MFYSWKAFYLCYTSILHFFSDDYLQKKILLRRNEWLTRELRSVFSEKIQLESELESLEKLLNETRNETINLIRSSTSE